MHQLRSGGRASLLCFRCLQSNLPVSSGQTLALSLLKPPACLDTVFLAGLAGSQYLMQNKLLFWAGAASISLIWRIAIGFGARWPATVFGKPSAWRLLDGLLALVMFYLAWDCYRRCARERATAALITDSLADAVELSRGASEESLVLLPR